MMREKIQRYFRELQDEICKKLDKLEGKEFSMIVRKEIDKMEAHYSTILTLFFLQDMSYDEIIAVTGLPLGTVKNRLFRARLLLRSAVLRHFSDMNQMVNV